MEEGERELGPDEVLRLALDPESDVLDRLESMELLQEAFETIRVDTVRQARDEGKSWEEIGGAMGKDRQNVWRKYASLVGEAKKKETPTRQAIRLRLEGTAE